MVLVTNKHSNIRQDIDTLGLFARVVSEYCRTTDEKEILKQAFDLLLIFDEIVSMGYRENVNLGQIRTIATMESHDERIQAEIEKNKEKEAKEELKRKSKMMDIQKREAGKKSGFGGSYGNSSSYNNSYSASPYNANSGSGYGANSSSSTLTSGQGNSSGYGAAVSKPSFTSEPVASQKPGRGMQLGGSVRKNSLLESIKADEGIRPQPVAAPAVQVQAQTETILSNEESVHIIIEEKVSMTANRDGGLANLEINGSFVLKVNDPKSEHIRVQMSSGGDGLQFKTHPNVDKAAWSSNFVICMKDPSRPFPVGQPLPLIKWRYVSQDESKVPLTVSCWPTPNATGCDVTVEYELQNTALELDHVQIVLPYPGSSAPTIGAHEGSYQVNLQSKTITWTLPHLDVSNASGTFEFSVSNDDVTGFYPIQVGFSSTNLMNAFNVVDVALASGGSAPYSVAQSLLTESYQIV